jgi:hypothetical protein
VRSLHELVFRLRQEAGNGWALIRPPAFSGDAIRPVTRLANPAPVAKLLEHTPFAQHVVSLAEEILEHRFRLFGYEIHTGPDIDWRRDYVHKRSSGTEYFRRIPYLDFPHIGDHKITWELNRHQHLALLAQAHLLTGRPEFHSEICDQIESWWTANPFLRGINWTSALEVAFRALSWLWVWHLTRERMAADFRRRFLESLYRHGCYIDRNLSIYFSPNTHLLGEAVALHALGALFPSFPDAARWESRGARIVEQQMQSQVRADGSHFEQSLSYHIYALDMFLFHHVLANTGAEFQEKLKRMAEYLAALLGPSASAPLLGDDDGGRFFHPYGDRGRFAAETLATFAALFPEHTPLSARAAGDAQAAWWVPNYAAHDQTTREPAATSQLFPDAGIAVMRTQDLQLIVDAGPFGHGSAGHSHSDTLSIVANAGAEEILIDPGTFTYVSDPRARNWFRGSAAHNTVRVDEHDQAVPAGPFRWMRVPSVKIVEWNSTGDRDYLHAICTTYVAIHRRRVLLLKRDAIAVIFDEVEAAAGEHLVEQFWHPGAETRPAGTGAFQIGSRTLLVMPTGTQCELTSGGEHGWRSRTLGLKCPAPIIRVWLRNSLPVRFTAVLDFSGAGGATLVALPPNACTYSNARVQFTVRWAANGFQLENLI